MLIGHDAGLQAEEYLITFLKETMRYDAIRCLIALIVAERRQDLLPTALPFLRFEQDREKVLILLDSFYPLKDDPEIFDVLKQLTQNIR